MRKYKDTILLVIVAISCFVCDLISKIIATNTLKVFERKEVIEGFFSFTLCYNTGGAWSIFSGNVIFLIIISIVALVAVIYTIIKSKTNFYKYRGIKILLQCFPLTFVFHLRFYIQINLHSHIHISFY